MSNKKQDPEVDQILNGLSGPLEIGKKYYFFTITYHCIGRVQRLEMLDGHLFVALDPSDAMVVMNAGSESDALTKIVQGKKKPEVCETPGANPFLICVQALTMVLGVK